MKNLILLLSVLFSCQMFAQKQECAVFDFTKPLELNPAITPLETNGQVEPVTSKTFTEKNIKLSFDGGSLRGSAGIATIITEGVTSYYLRVFTTTTMTISAQNNSVLDSIRFAAGTIMGELGLPVNDNTGKFDSSDGKLWTKNGDNNISKVSFYNNFAMAQIPQLYVYYTTPSDVLTPISTSIYNGQTVPSFESFRLTFDREMNIVNTSGITLTYSDGTSAGNVSVSKTNSNIVVSLSKPITKDCDLILTIPARAFASNDGYQNAELTYSFKVVEPRNTFNYTEAIPAIGKVKMIPNTISLVFPDIIGHVNEDAIIVLFKDGEPHRTLKLTSDENKVNLTINGTSSDITEEGTYTLKIKEGAISNALYGTDYERHNEEYNITYIVTSETDEPGTDPEPEPDPQPEESETMKAAKSLLALTGIGYPTEESSSRASLKALTEAEEVPTDEALASAIDAFYKEPNIAKPVSKKYYQISSVNANGSKLWLTYNDGSVTLTTDASKATAFKATANEDGTTTFAVNGKYLHVLASDSRYDETSESNVTDEYSSTVNNLMLQKFIVEGKEAKDMLGLVTLYGGLGKDKVSKEDKTAYALVDHSTASVLTQAEYNASYFEADMTNAFAINEIDVPAEVNYSISPDLVKKNTEVLTLTFPEESFVDVSESVKPYFITNSGVNKGYATLTRTSDNMFTISLAGLSDDKYIVVLPQGTFTITVGDEIQNIMEIRHNFEINGGGGSGDDGGFDYSYSAVNIYGFGDILEPKKDSQLNNIIIYQYSRENDLAVDTNKEVWISNYDNVNKKLYKGKFVPYVIEEMPETPAYRLALETPIVEGSLAKGLYAVVFEKGTFGDANFRKYLEDKTSVSPSQCRVNALYRIRIDIDNTYVSGIDDVLIDKNKEDVIVDLQGRRVSKMAKGGLYIINGKKYLNY